MHQKNFHRFELFGEVIVHLACVAWDPLKLWQKAKKKNVLKTEKIPLPLIPAIQIIYISSTMHRGYFQVQ